MSLTVRNYGDGKSGATKMSLRQRLEDNLLTAIKAKDQLTRDVLRGVKSALKNREIALKTDSLDNSEVEKIIAIEVKKRKESIEAFQKANKPKLTEIEQQELKLLEKYLPEPMSDQDVEKIITGVIEKLGDSANIGSVMRELSAKLQGQADMGSVSKLVAQKLTK